MRFIDSLNNPPAPPPAPPAMPYIVDVRPFGPGGLLRPVKAYPNGQGGPLLTDDEVGVWKHIAWREQAFGAAAPNATIGDPPPLPYDARPFSYGLDGRQRLAKVRRLSGGSEMGGELLTPEEAQVWAYLQHFEARLAARRARPAEEKAA